MPTTNASAKTFTMPLTWFAEEIPQLMIWHLTGFEWPFDSQIMHDHWADMCLWRKSCLEDKAPNEHFTTHYRLGEPRHFIPRKWAYSLLSHFSDSVANGTSFSVSQEQVHHAVSVFRKCNEAIFYFTGKARTKPFLVFTCLESVV